MLRLHSPDLRALSVHCPFLARRLVLNVTGTLVYGATLRRYTCAARPQSGQPSRSGRSHVCVSLLAPQVTEDVHRLLRGSYVLVCRGTVSVKGKGDMLTYFLEGKSQSPGSQRPPKGLERRAHPPSRANVRTKLGANFLSIGATPCLQPRSAYSTTVEL